MNLNSEEALFSLMQLYYDELFRYGIKFTANEEETKDALNQFFIHLWDNRDKLTKVTNQKAYIFVSYKRWLIVHLRKFQKRNKLFSGEMIEILEQPFESYLIEANTNGEWAQLLAEAIQLLSKRQKQLIQLRFYEHLDFEQIAERTSLSVRTVYNKLHEALKNLRSNKALLHFRNQM